MSVLIKDMEKPKTCYAVIDGEFEYCPFVNTDDDCVLLLKKGICGGTWKEQYSKCPLVEAPEPCEDAVSRKAVYDAMVEKGQRSRRYKLGETWELNGIEIREALDTVPSVTPKQAPCEDAISRKSILDKISKKDNWEKYDRYNIGLSDARRIVQDEPSVTPKRKTGKWKKIGHWGRCYRCDQCGNILDFDGVNAGRGDANFCPNCGANMNPLP